MNLRAAVLSAVTLAAVPAFAQGNDAGDVDAIVAAVKTANPELRALCQQGPDGIRKAVTEAVMGLMSAGKLKGNPQALGGEAGQRIGRECRGG